MIGILNTKPPNISYLFLSLFLNYSYSGYSSFFREKGSGIINKKYEHLYKKSIYTPPSVQREELALLKKSDAIRKNIESETNQTTFDTLFSYTLRNKDVYADMKNKILFSPNEEVLTHARLNVLSDWR